ncbi:permease [Candidatus Deianiraea vastatrix]|uniref:Permease n=1 Tax=Candidatus Deianiraea vastatrix TaxID=2163644 RepID=A0A5B8XE27_9RICK|nr:permease [Candidatus Deianiraea vastatrix]QED23256.1 Putative permease [Candidatus Deianiraea vastatrix]
MFLKIADFVLENLQIQQGTKLYDALHFFIYDFIKILTVLFLMMIVVSYFRHQIDFEKMAKYLEKKSKFMAYFLASFLGAVTPFCSCSSISIFIGFMQAKIPFGIAMSFLITSPLINEVAVALLLPVFGFKITLIYILTGFGVGILGGILMQRFYNKDHIAQDILERRDLGDTRKLKNSKENHFQYALNYAISTIESIWIYVAIGVGVGAFLHGYIPREFFINHFSANNIFTVPIAVLSGIPLYMNATGVIPFAQVLFEKGVPIGTVLVVMMSIVGVSLPELMMLKRVFKMKMIVKFTLFLLFSFIILGYLYNIIF